MNICRRVWSGLAGGLASQIFVWRGCSTLSISFSFADRGLIMSAIRKKFVIVGDGLCGKTCLLMTFSTGKFPEGYKPRTVENDVFNLNVDGTTVELEFCDTVGEDDFDVVRPLAYPNTDVIVMCFSVDRPESLESIAKKWTPELRQHCPKAPIILVGNKKDLRHDQRIEEMLSNLNQSPVTSEQGREMCEQIKGHVYLECSSKALEGVRDVFETAARAALLKNRDRKRCCIF